MKILMIGLGSIGQRHLRNIRALYGDTVEIIAYRVRGLARTFSNDMKIRENVVLENEFNITTYTKLEEALAQKPDVAFITNITSLHVECATKCAEAGCHLFIEKPLSYNLAGIETLQKIVKEKNLVAFMGFQNRYNPCVKKLKETIEKNLLGDLVAVNVDMGERLTTMHSYENYAETYMARKDMGGGVVLNQQIHEIDYLTYIFGMPKSVYAIASNNNPLTIDVDDNSSALYDFNGLPVFVHSDFMQFPPTRKCKVIGAKGYMEIDLINNCIVEVVNDQLTKTEFTNFQRNDMFIEELRLFMDCVKNGELSGSSLDDGVTTLKIGLATLRSIEQQKRIDIL